MHNSHVSTGDIQACCPARDGPHLVLPRAGGPTGSEVTVGTAAPPAAGCPVQSRPWLCGAVSMTGLWRSGHTWTDTGERLWDQFWLGIWRLWKWYQTVSTPGTAAVSPSVPLGKPELALHWTINSSKKKPLHTKQNEKPKPFSVSPIIITNSFYNIQLNFYSKVCF